MSTSSPEAVKKLVENMQADLRSLSMECKKKFPPVKEVHIDVNVWIYNIYLCICLCNAVTSIGSSGSVCIRVAVCTSIYNVYVMVPVH